MTSRSARPVKHPFLLFGACLVAVGVVYFVLAGTGGAATPSWARIRELSAHSQRHAGELVRVRGHLVVHTLEVEPRSEGTCDLRFVLREEPAATTGERHELRVRYAGCRLPCHLKGHAVADFAPHLKVSVLGRMEMGEFRAEMLSCR